jgi:hypothetical protein
MQGVEDDVCEIETDHSGHVRDGRGRNGEGRRLLSPELQPLRHLVRFDRELKIPKEREEAEKKEYGEGFNREAGVQCLALDLTDDGALDARKLWEWSMRGTADTSRRA